MFCGYCGGHGKHRCSEQLKLFSPVYDRDRLLGGFCTRCGVSAYDHKDCETQRHLHLLLLKGYLPILNHEEQFHTVDVIYNERRSLLVRLPDWPITNVHSYMLQLLFQKRRIALAPGGEVLVRHWFNYRQVTEAELAFFGSDAFLGWAYAAKKFMHLHSTDIGRLIKVGRGCLNLDTWWMILPLVAQLPPVNAAVYKEACKVGFLEGIQSLTRLKELG